MDSNHSSILDAAIQLREAGKINQAIELLREEIKQFPEEADLLALLSHCFILADELGEAGLYLDRARQIAPANASVGWNTARLKLKEKNASEALNVAKDTSRRFPEDIEGMGVLGACLRANGYITEGLKVLNQAIELNSNYAEALVQRGLIRLSQESKPEALADFEFAHSLKPHIKPIWDLIVGLKVEAQEYSDAILLLINMIEIDPSWQKGFSLLAACNQKVDDSALAVKSFEKVLEMNEHRIRDKALSIMGGYTYEDAQLDGFQERVRIDLKKSFSMVLRKYRDGESDLIRQIYFTQFVVQ